MIAALGWVLTAQADTLVEFRRDTAQALHRSRGSPGEPSSPRPDVGTSQRRMLQSRRLASPSWSCSSRVSSEAGHPGRCGLVPSGARTARSRLRTADRSTLQRSGRCLANRRGLDAARDRTPRRRAGWGPKGLSADQLSEFIGAVAAEVRAHDADARIIGPRLPGTLRSSIATGARRSRGLSIGPRLGMQERW